jgi:hypothetical protein
MDTLVIYVKPLFVYTHFTALKSKKILSYSSNKIFTAYEMDMQQKLL